MRPAYTPSSEMGPDAHVPSVLPVGKTLTPSTPALPHTPKTPPPANHYHPTTPEQKPLLSLQNFYTPPPPSSRRLVSSMPVAPASAPRNRMPQAVSPFKDRVPFGVEEEDEEHEDDGMYEEPTTPERRNGGPVLGESPPSPPGLAPAWRPKLSGLSPSQREGWELGQATAVTVGRASGARKTPSRGRVVTFPDQPRQEAAPEFLIQRQVDREREKAKRQKLCGSCDRVVPRPDLKSGDKDDIGVKVSPCGCFVCSTWYAASISRHVTPYGL